MHVARSGVCEWTHHPAGLGALTLDHCPGVDAHWTYRTAEAVNGAGINAVRRIVAHELCAQRRIIGDHHLTLQHNALTWREAARTRWTYMLAETTFNAEVRRVLFFASKCRHRLQVRDVCCLVRVDQDVAVENILRIEQLLYALHDRKSSLAPFMGNKGRHVSAGAVLGFE